METLGDSESMASTASPAAAVPVIGLTSESPRATELRRLVAAPRP